MTEPDDNFAPIDTESRGRPTCPILGEIPRELNGTLFRNGPNPQFPSPAQHWFLGDGMLHAIILQDGRASYRNRWVRTGKFLAERKAGHALPFDDPHIRDDGVANTNIVEHAGRLLALEEAHAPIEIDPATLGTRAPHALGGEGPVTAHPKIDPVSGAMHFFGYSATGPFSPAIRFGSADGQVPSAALRCSRRPIAAWCTTSWRPSATSCSRSCRSPAALPPLREAFRSPGSRNLAGMSVSCASGPAPAACAGSAPRPATSFTS